MKYTGRIFVFIFILIFQYSLVAYLYYENGYIEEVNYIATPVMLFFGYFIGKQFDKVKFYSEKDILTNLYNRRFIMTNFKKFAAAAERMNSKFFILVIDCDNFKEINDLYGHIKGDEILKSIGECLISATRKGDITARWGGDEFLVIGYMKDETDLTISLNKLEEKLDKLSEKLKIPVYASVGSAIFPNESKDLLELIKIADDNMYYCKGLKKKEKIT
ncbi:GGDEF domain-containing protein [Metabacillus fastidiosus]|uniref:GGDEF domain-containing protein n=1 Tax=Metabacillus fastidiosus TaxID=1458 RepID=UPI003D2E71C8